MLSDQTPLRAEQPPDRLAPGRAVVEAVRTAFYRCEVLPQEVYDAVREYERVRNGCRCKCHDGDDHCDRCCHGSVLCPDCIAYSEPDQ